MDFEGVRRTGVVLGAGAVVALAAGGLIAWGLMAGHRNEPRPPPPASKGGLVINPNQPEPRPVAAAKTLRCFVSGQLVGEFTLAECAQRNGVATDKLDVGVDPTGALAAAQPGGSVVSPLPPASEPVRRLAPKPQPTPSAGPLGACWRYAEGTWRKLPYDMALNLCARTLFDGRCEKPGQALYGRWAQQTIRLVPGKVEISSDNRSFRGLMDQGQGCSLPTG